MPSLCILFSLGSFFSSLFFLPLCNTAFLIDWLKTNYLGCIDTPFLTSCRCSTRVRHRNRYDSPDFDVWAVFFFSFLFFHFFDTAPTRCQHASSGKKNHIFWQMDLPIPLILWYTLKQQVWQVIRPKPTSHSQVLTSQPTLPLTFARCCCCYPLSLVKARLGQPASSIDVDLFAFKFFFFFFLIFYNFIIL